MNSTGSVTREKISEPPNTTSPAIRNMSPRRGISIRKVNSRPMIRIGQSSREEMLMTGTMAERSLRGT